MKQSRDERANSCNGFTIIEVVLALGLTGLLFAGAMIGVGGSVARQRFKDTTQQAVNMIREQYDAVSRIHINERESDALCKIAIDAAGMGSVSSADSVNSSRGRTDCNIYGTALILGADKGNRMQAMPLIGVDFAAYRKFLLDHPDMIGAMGEGNYADVDAYLMSLNEVELLGRLVVNNHFKAPDNPDLCKTTNITTSRSIPWGGILQDVQHTEKSAKKAMENELYSKMIILIVRSPRDGTIHTYVHDINEASNPISHKSPVDIIEYGSLDGSCKGVDFNGQDIKALLDSASFRAQEVNLCINSEDSLTGNNRRRNVRIAKDGHGSSAVQLIDFDNDADDLCNK